MGVVAVAFTAVTKLCFFCVRGRAEASASRVCVCFIDCIDVVARARGGARRSALGDD